MPTTSKKKTLKESKSDDSKSSDSKSSEDDKSEDGEKGNKECVTLPECLASPKKDASTDPFEISGDLIKKDDLKELLECPVCLRVPHSSPIYQCVRGHIVCSECRANVSVCPQCREPMGNIRSLVSEKMLEKMPSTCKFSDQGCQVEMMQTLLKEHEKECPFRLVNCVDLACQQRISVSKLLNHLENDHETEDFVRVEGGEYNSHFIVHEEDFSKSIMWISDQLRFDERYFYRECCRSKEGLWYIWIYLLETEQCKVADYICRISIRSADGEEELSSKCFPLSLDLTKENVSESGKGLVFTDTTARLFWQDNKVRYSVILSKK